MPDGNTTTPTTSPDARYTYDYGIKDENAFRKKSQAEKRAYLTPIVEQAIRQGEDERLKAYSGDSSLGIDELVREIYLQKVVLPPFDPDAEPIYIDVYPLRTEPKEPSGEPNNVTKGADPVNLFTGSLDYSTTDFSLSGAGIDFSFTRTHSNQPSYQGPLGAKWDHNYNLWLRVTADHNIIYRSNGRLTETLYRRHNIHDYWFADIGESGVIKETSDGFLWRSSEGVEFYYMQKPFHNVEVFVISTIRDRFGNYLQFKYKDHLLSRVLINNPERYVTFSYDSNNRIISINDFSGRRWTYTYDDLNDLVAVTTPATEQFKSGLVKRYEYTTATVSDRVLQHNLTAIIDANGRIFLENEYGVNPGLISYNRVVRQRQGTGEIFFDYQDVVEDFGLSYESHQRPAYQTIVIERTGHPIRYLFNSFGNMILKEEYARINGLPSRISTHYRYNKDGNLTGTITPSGVITQYLYGRDLYEKNNPPGNDYRYDTDSNLTSQKRQGFNKLLSIVRRGKFYNINSLNLSHGLWSGTIFPDIFETNDEDIVQKFAYEPEFHQLLTLSDPRYTQSADPAFSENIEYERHLTRYFYSPGSSYQNLYLKSIELPAAATPDGILLSAITNKFEFTDAGKLQKVIASNGLETDIYYYSATDSVLEGFIHSTSVDSAGLNIKTEVNRDMLGRLTKIYRPKFFDSFDGRFFDTAEYNVLDQIVRHTGTAPFTINTHYSYDRTGNLSRAKIELKDQHNVAAGNFEINSRYNEESGPIYQRAGVLGNDTIKQSKVIYDRASRPVLSIDPSGRKTKTIYDERSFVRKTILDYGGIHSSTKIFYDAEGNSVRSINERGFVSRFWYDAIGRLVKAENPIGNKVILHYDKIGNIIAECRYERNSDNTYTLVFRQESTFDAMGRKISDGINKFESAPPIAENQLQTAFIDSGPGELLTTKFFYDNAGNLAKVIDQSNRKFLSEFDLLGRTTKKIDPNGNEIHFQYDKESNVLRVDRKEVTRDIFSNSIISTRYFAESFQYDELNRITEKKNSLGNAIQYQYDSRGNLVEIKDPLNNRIENQFDTFGRLTLTMPAAIAYKHNKDDAITVQTDAQGHTTQFWYDTAGRLISSILPDGSTDSLMYDRSGNIVEYRDRKGLIKKLEWDELNRNVVTRIGQSGILTTTYDGLGRVKEAKNNFMLNTFRYNSLNHTLDEKISFSSVPGIDDNSEFKIHRKFDNNGALMSLIYPSGRQLSYSRDILGRVIKIEQTQKGSPYPGNPATDNAVTLVRIEYEGLQPKKIFRNNNTHTDYMYDFGGRIIQIRHSNDHTNILTLQFLYNAIGDLVSKAELSDDYQISERYQYDSLSRLTAVSRSDTASLLDLSILMPPTSPTPSPIPNYQSQINQLVPSITAQENRQYNYDLTGNRKSVLAGGTTQHYQTNMLDQYVTINSEELRYDANGNLIEDDEYFYQYDHRNQLAKVVRKVDNHEMEFLYDSFGRRCVQLNSDSTRLMIYDSHNLLEEHEGHELKASVLSDTIQDNLLMSAKNGREFYFYSDLIKSVRYLFAEDQKYNFYNYDEFGNLANTMNVVDDNAFLFGGKYLLPGINKYDFIFRTYDPSTGKFIQRDPRGYVDGTNMYVYTANNPLVFSDPYGMDKRPEQSINSGIAAARATNAPMDVNGRPLRGPYNLWSGATASGLLGEAQAKAAAGYVMEQTPHHQKALDALVPKAHGGQGATFEEAWHPTSRATAREAALSLTPVASYGLNTHPNPTHTVQYKIEIPTVQKWGGLSASGLKVSGVLDIWAAAQVDNPAVKGIGLAAGGAELFGGTLYFGGALTMDTSMMALGSKFGRFGGGISLAVVSGHTFIQDVKRGNVRDAIGSGANSLTGITMLVSSNPFALAATGTFAASYNASRYISQKTGWGETSGRVGASIANFIMGDDPGWIRTGAGYTLGLYATSVGTVIVEPTVFVGKKIGQGAMWAGGKVADVYDAATDFIGYEFCMPFVNCD